MTAETLLEICVEDPAGLEAAISGGADRIELCAALAVGGLTPSAGFVRMAVDRSVPVHVLIRPRAGGFHYDRRETEVMLADVAMARQAGAAGVVVGGLRADGTLDEALVSQVVAAAGRMQVVLNRAFDLLADREAALETAVALGIDAILTSGGAAGAAEGRRELARLSARAAGRVGLIAAGGIRAGNVRMILATAPLVAVHASCRTPAAADRDLAAFGFEPGVPSRTDRAEVQALKAAITRRAG